ncbi:unnamed protein product [Cuscuta campestris]|uniref:Uncharacterized protein n=1 Tax=Cuscuta campestris TaxID=132261 RepID=A0A484M2J0_9ASTE|nr:unnamed protein product [Cuscuta campestris]
MMRLRAFLPTNDKIVKMHMHPSPHTSVTHYSRIGSHFCLELGTPTVIIISLLSGNGDNLYSIFFIWIRIPLTKDQIIALTIAKDNNIICICQMANLPTLPLLESRETVSKEAPGSTSKVALLD